MTKPDIQPADLNDVALTYQEAAAIAKVSPTTVRGWPIKRARLGHRTVRIMKSDLIAYLKERAA